MKIGIDLGGSHIEVGLISDDKILDKFDRNFTLEDKRDIKNVIIREAVGMINRLLEKNKLGSNEVESIGVASPGIITKGTILKASNLGIENFALCDEIEKATGIKANIRNDGKCAGLAEKTYGALKPYNDAVFLCIGTGIGGAVFLGR